MTPAAGERTGRRPSRSGTTPPATACARSTGSSPAKPAGWWSGTRPSLCQALEGRSFRLAWNGPEGYESRTLGAQEQLAQALPELMKSPAQESDPPLWQEAGTVICLCCRVPPDLPENALVLRCSQQGGEPGVFTPEQMPQQIQQWIRSAQ